MIETKTIQENAIKICNFLELSIIDNKAKKNPKYIIPFSNISCLEYWPCREPTLAVETHIRASETLFHSDWNWIIIVINKFEEVWHKEGLESMSRETDKLAQNIHIDTLNIENTYNAVMKFIEWYNNKI